GNDTRTGGGGNDVFVFAQNFGKDIITDVNVNQDTINWTLAKGEGAPVIKDVGGNAVATFGNDSITFLGVHAADLVSHHIFG
ncbi:hypothetical protein, partial [Staphylococcus pseudintermedius]|uniref:hypothetical protein n=1 Tax=Staphylococcus pseudintermedius TaxID=283734 RepID=UPI001C6F16D1